VVEELIITMDHADLESGLKGEVEKWLLKIREERKTTKLLDQKRKHMLTNMDAYIKDSEYFLKRGDLIRAFEAVIWAWSILEIGRELKIFR
jgi:hypothetical protein